MLNQVIRHDTPPSAPAPQGIYKTELMQEWRMIYEGMRLACSLPNLLKLPKGQDRVVLVPGWKTHELTMEPMRLFLKALGYQAEHWGLGINRGDPEADCDRLKQRLLDSFETDPSPVALVGWSLGGTIAREMARHLPEQVFGVVTYGSPVIGGPSYTIGRQFYPESECLRAQALVEQLDRDLPIQPPMSVIFSKNDQFVHWPACIDRASRQVTHFEVESPHMAMGLNPAVWATIARQLHVYQQALETPTSMNSVCL